MHPPARIRLAAPRLRSLRATVACSCATLALAACAPAATQSPPTQLPATAPPATTAAATARPGRSDSGPSGTAAAPIATIVAFESAAYHYSMTLPAGWTVTAARTPWDGSDQVNSDGPYVDRFTGPAGELFFVYGAPTTLGLDAFAADQQAKVATWHGCPATASLESDQVVRLASGADAPARMHGFTCQGLMVYKLMSVAGGIGIVLNELSVPADEPTQRAAFLSRVASVTWTP